MDEHVNIVGAVHDTELLSLLFSPAHSSGGSTFSMLLTSRYAMVGWVLMNSLTPLATGDGIRYNVDTALRYLQGSSKFQCSKLSTES